VDGTAMLAVRASLFLQTFFIYIYNPFLFATFMYLCIIYLFIFDILVFVLGRLTTIWGYAAQKEPKLKLGREDSSSSDEAGFVSPLASPHNVAPHRSLKEEIEREKERERDRLDDARQRREEAAEEEAERRAQGGPSQAGDSETSGADAQHKRERATVGESSEDLGLSLDDVDFDHPFPELDYNLRQPFDPENSTSYKLLHLRFVAYAHAHAHAHAHGT
jgi:hypothetical protein